jgi:hypothetical protein
MVSPAPSAPPVPTATPGTQDVAAAPNGADAATIEPEPGTDADPALDWHAFVPTDVADHLATMDAAARDSGCGVPWQLLASIARVESDFGRNMATSSAGAMGYGQFLPSSWQVFGNDGNVYDYRAALPAIATYLCVSGLARDPRAALFAYNHADWYVDLVLDLAVRYDRMAPGAPIPDVLDVGPDVHSAIPMHYATGRDLKLQAAARTVSEGGGAEWLAVPWRGRAPGQPIDRSTLDVTALGMLRAAFGLNGDPSRFAESGGDQVGLESLAARAWNAGLLPLRALPEERPAPALRADDTSWTLDQLRGNLRQGIPMVALVASAALPGHPPNEVIGDQPIVLIGVTADALVYSDPTFSSSLGYGLVLPNADFAAAWEHASTPRQALGFALRPRVLAPAPHVQEADPPSVGRRVLATPTPPRATPPVALVNDEATPQVAPLNADSTPGALANPVPAPPFARADSEAALTRTDAPELASAPGHGDVTTDAPVPEPTGHDLSLAQRAAFEGAPSAAAAAADAAPAMRPAERSGGDTPASAISLAVIGGALVCGLLLTRFRRVRP